MSCSVKDRVELIKEASTEQEDEESKKCKSRGTEERVTPRLVTVMQINKPSTRVGLISSNNSLDKTTQRFVSDESEDGHCKILSSAVKSLASEVENAI